MTTRWTAALALFACVAAGGPIAGDRRWQAPRGIEKGTDTGKATRIRRATGPFDVKLTPQATDSGPMLGRMSIDKQFHGDLEAASKGEMLTAGTSIKDSAGYVAIERVAGTLHGRTGTFILQHSGTMNRGQPSLTVSVVPDSGTGELTGLTGTMTIDIGGGKHAYVFDYSIK